MITIIVAVVAGFFGFLIGVRVERGREELAAIAVEEERPAGSVRLRRIRVMR